MAKTKKNPLPVAKTSSPVDVRPSKDYEAQERRYKAEEAMRTMERAEEFKKDKSLMKDIKGLAKEKIKNLGKIC